MTSNSCPVGSLQSFPVGITATLTQDSYKNAKNYPLNINFTWGTRTTPPKFSYAGSGEIDHIVNDNGTYLNYNNFRFNLASVQLTSPTHNRWLLPITLEATKMDNLEDFIMTYQLDTFNTNGQKDPKFIILVNPILRMKTSIANPTYLTNLANNVGSSATLEALFPYKPGSNYAYYTTCIPGSSLDQPYRNILVILNTQGSLVSNALMTSIKTMYNKFSQGAYPSYIPLAVFSVSPSLVSSVSRIEGFQQASVSKPVETSTTGKGDATAYNTMKCVPFNPEQNLTKDGMLVINTKDGTPFTLKANASISDKRNVLAALKNADGTPQYPNVDTMSDDDTTAAYLKRIPMYADRDGQKTIFKNGITGIVPFSSVELAARSAVAIILGIILLLLLINFIQSVRGDTSWIGRSWSTIEFLVFNCGLFIAGFIVGMIVIPAKCPGSSS